MKKILLLFCVLSSMFVSAADFVKAKVIRVIDGDTIVVNVENQETKVRLAAIDAPEMKQPGGEESKQWLQKQIGDKDIYLKIVDTDQYGREVAYIYNSQPSNFYAKKSINNLSIDSCMSWIYTAIDTNSLIHEKACINCSIGIFALSKTPPWEFRESKRDENIYMKWKELPVDASFDVQWNYEFHKGAEKAKSDFADHIKKNTPSSEILISAYTFSKWNHEMLAFFRDKVFINTIMIQENKNELTDQKVKIELLESRIKKLEEIISKGAK